MKAIRLEFKSIIGAVFKCITEMKHYQYDTDYLLLEFCRYSFVRGSVTVRW